MAPLAFRRFLLPFLLVLSLTSISTTHKIPTYSPQKLLGERSGRAHNEPWYPNPSNPVPYKKPLPIDERANWFRQFHNGSHNGYYRRSSCPAINMLANRGYINRSGRDITYENLYRAVRDVYNFGEDNVSSSSGNGSSKADEVRACL